MTKRFERFVMPLVSLVLGLALALVFASLAGESPIHVLKVLIQGSLGSSTQIGYSLFFATPLILTGLSVAWAFRAGLFNIGAEGQMALGGLAMAAIGLSFPHLHSIIALPLALVGAFVVGGLWGAAAGWMKAHRGCHEVLTTILLNFVAYGLVSFFILSVFKNPESQVPETMEIGEGYRLSPLTWLGGQSPLSTAFFIAMFFALVFWFVFAKTRLGFRQRLVGQAAELARRSGVVISNETIKAMFISGGIAGTAGAAIILGFAFKAREGFTAGLGFVGVAVALLGRNSAVGVVLAAIFFGVLTKGALDLDLDTENVTRELALVIQALVVISVASQAGFWNASNAIKEMIKIKMRSRHG